MSKSLIYILALISLPFLLKADARFDALFAKGNAQYSKGQYKEAVQSYQSIIADGNQSATVYFDLGNTYYKLGDMPSAILYYEKAHKLQPGDEDIAVNIRLANQKLTDKIDAAPDFFLTKWWDAFILCCSVGMLGWLSVLFILAGCGILIAYLYASTVSLKRTTFYTSIVLIFFGLVTISMAANQVHYFASNQQAVVFSNSVTVKSEPANAAKTLFVIHEGTKVDVLENNNNWMRVKLLNGNEGWIPVGDVKEI